MNPRLLVKDSLWCLFFAGIGIALGLLMMGCAPSAPKKFEDEKSVCYMLQPGVMKFADSGAISCYPKVTVIR